MTFELRPKQRALVNDIYRAWNDGARNVLAVSPTGSGKTVIFSHIVQEMNRVTVAIAHRAELVGQMSLALARNGIRHRVMAQPELVREIEGQHMAELGRRFVDPHSNVIAAGVQTLINRTEPWMEQCGLWVVDEGHHLIKGNVWGRAIDKLPNALGLSVTATPMRADGKGLGRSADGVVDVMVQGPGMRELIEDGHLSDYRIFAPPSDLDMSGVAITGSGDYSPEETRKRVHRSHITGDIVQHYLRLAKGKRGITFTVDVEAAEEVARAYRDAGVPAEVLTGKSPTVWRSKVMRALRTGEVLQVVNCDLLGEGTDVPAVEVVSFGRPTASYGLFAQQFGRVLRVAPGKSHGIVIDHVGNVKRHGLPDAYREWSLDKRERRSSSAPADVIPITVCPSCSGAYERVLGACPYCAAPRSIVRRDGPEFVDGDLIELDAATLAAMRGEVARVDGAARIPVDARGTPVEAAITRNHAARQLAQRELRNTMMHYGGLWLGRGDDLRAAQRRFYLTFGLDVMTAQTLGAGEADRLRAKIDEKMRAPY